MRIATYNINGINSRLPILLHWLAESAPDIACLQELKAPDAAFPHAALAEAGYEAISHGQQRWNGVAILSRVGTPVETRRGLPNDPDPGQSRYLEAAVAGILVGCLYLPNGNPRPGPKFDYKLRWLEAFAAHAESLRECGAPVVLAGDFNIIPTPFDVYKPERWTDDALFAPDVREAFAALVASGWRDSLRHLHPDEHCFTFWHYWRHSFERDAGLRIDHLLLNPLLAKKLKSAGVDRGPRGLDKSSDHAPVWIELRR